MGIEPHFNLWNYFFHARLLHGSGMEVVVLGGVDLYVRARHACALSKMTHMLAIVRVVPCHCRCPLPHRDCDVPPINNDG
jgi:hypothetical protein